MSLILDRRTFVLGALAAASVASPAGAREAILAVDGRIAGSAPKTFTLEDLEALPQAGFTTKTPWHPEPVAFEGVDLEAFLRTVGADGTRLRLGALNDYVVMVDLADIGSKGALLALRMNGALMPISDKGPIFLVFPFDRDTALQHQSFYSRAIWQLATISVE